LVGTRKAKKGKRGRPSHRQTAKSGRESPHWQTKKKGKSKKKRLSTKPTTKKKRKKKKNIYTFDSRSLAGPRETKKKKIFVGPRRKGQTVRTLTGKGEGRPASISAGNKKKGAKKKKGRKGQRSPHFTNFPRNNPKKKRKRGEKEGGVSLYGNKRISGSLPKEEKGGRCYLKGKKKKEKGGGEEKVASTQKKTWRSLLGGRRDPSTHSETLKKKKNGKKRTRNILLALDPLLKGKEKVQDRRWH